MGAITRDSAAAIVKAALARELRIPVEKVQLEAVLSRTGVNENGIRRVANHVEAELGIVVDTKGVTTGETFVQAVVAASLGTPPGPSTSPA
ncbi:hypothetical protein ACFZCK_22760 [Kitasatospora purpeofusca]|uniref:hypothetical protein n=1 Tax=Kitasatospora purpeofusca TaxID=67352 RepID=UPI0036E142D2